MLLNVKFCIYCDAINANTRDHTIPQSISDNHSFEEKYVVPCCKECNSLLGNVPEFTIEERAAYLYTQYQKRYKTDLKWPDRSDEELKEFGRTLRTKLKKCKTLKQEVNRKLVSLRKIAGNYLTETIKERESKRNER